ncbi:MAG: hypothetical protein ACI9P5_004759 [Saprospiraceae bacterium]|jgi:hypothetical protein
MKSNNANHLRLAYRKIAPGSTNHLEGLKCLTDLLWIHTNIENHFKEINHQKNENLAQRKRNYPTRSR